MIELLALLIIAPTAAFSLCFCVHARERTKRAEQERQLHCDPNYVKLKMAELRLAEEETGPKMLVGHNGNGKVVVDDDASDR
jgi:hypothetical protein